MESDSQDQTKTHILNYLSNNGLKFKNMIPPNIQNHFHRLPYRLNSRKYVP